MTDRRWQAPVRGSRKVWQAWGTPGVDGDRPGLEAAACECYGIIAREYARVLGDESPQAES